MPELISVALGTDSDMQLELVATTGVDGSGTSVWRARQTPSGDQWALGWQPLGKPGRGIPDTVSVIQPRPGGLLEAFVIDDKDGAAWHSWQADADGGWSGWDLLGNPGGSHALEPVTLTRLDPGLVMAVVLADGSLWHVSSPQPEPSAFWPAWTSLGHPAGAPAQEVSAATLADGRAEVFAVGKVPAGPSVPGFGIFGTLWHRWQETAGGTQWSGWAPLGMPHGKPVGQLRLAENDDRRLELFAKAGDGLLWHRALQTATDPGSWSDWALLHPSGPQRGVLDFAVARAADGRLVLIGSSGYQVLHTAQTAAGADTWTPWATLATVPGPPAADGEKLGRPAVGFNQAGLLEIFVVTATGGVLHRLQATPSGQVTLAPQTFPQP